MNEIIIFIDGSYIKKINKGGYGIYFTNPDYDSISGKITLKKITSQRTELYSFYQTLNYLDKLEKHNEKIKIYSDSLYCINIYEKWIKKWIKNNWKKDIKDKNGYLKDLENLDIIKPTYELYKKFNNIKLFHVKSHTNKTDDISYGNSIADKLALKGATR